MIPATVFYYKALGEAVVKKEVFLANIKEYAPRVAVEAEKDKLIELHYIGDMGPEISMVPIRKDD
jgi:hypothetical protein